MIGKMEDFSYFSPKSNNLVYITAFFLYFFLFHNGTFGAPLGTSGPQDPSGSTFGTLWGPKGHNWPPTRKTQKDYQDRSVPSRARLGPL